MNYSKQNQESFKDKIKKYFIPQEDIGGLEINDKVIKIIGFKNSHKTVKYSGIIQIAPQTITNGFLAKPESLIQALNLLKNQIAKQQPTPPYVILSLPPNNFYTNIITIPKNTILAANNFEETVKLNTRLISPIPLENAYFDWEVLPNEETAENISVFVGIGDKNNIDRYLEALKACEFRVIAVEKPALGLMRFINQFSSNKEPYLLINIDRDGIDLIIAKQIELIFYDFDSWQEVMRFDLRKFLTTKEFEIYLTNKISQIMNYYQSRYSQSLANFYFFSVIENLKGHAVHFIQEKFNLKPILLSNDIPLFIKNISEEWYSTIGTALRGLIPRGEDTIISLMATGTEREYEQSKLIRYLSLWTKITATILIALVAIFGSLCYFFYIPFSQRIINSEQTTASAEVLKQKRESLEKEVDKSNFYIKGLYNALLTSSFDWSLQFQTLFDTAKQYKINVLQIFISAPSNNITLHGEAPSRKAITDFKDALEQTKLFTSISAPLESLSGEGDKFYFSFKFSFATLPIPASEKISN